jgi:hypothetical protein
MNNLQMAVGSLRLAVGSWQFAGWQAPMTNLVQEKHKTAAIIICNVKASAGVGHVSNSTFQRFIFVLELNISCKTNTAVVTFIYM